MEYFCKLFTVRASHNAIKLKDCGKTANCNNSSQILHTSTKENMVWMWSAYLDTDSGSGLLPKFNVEFLVQGYICDKSFTKILSLNLKGSFQPYMRNTRNAKFYASNQRFTQAM